MAEGPIKVGAQEQGGPTDNLASLSMREGADYVMRGFGKEIFIQQPTFSAAVLTAYMTTEAQFAIARELGRIADALNRQST